MPKHWNKVDMENISKVSSIEKGQDFYFWLERKKTEMNPNQLFHKFNLFFASNFSSITLSPSSSFFLGLRQKNFSLIFSFTQSTDPNSHHVIFQARFLKRKVARLFKNLSDSIFSFSIREANGKLKDYVF